MLETTALIFIAILLVLLNGFFVAAEFALVKIRKGQLEQLVRDGRPFAKTAMWLGNRMDGTLSACQLGITMASLALGWVAEPAFHKLMEPLFHSIGLGDTTFSHVLAFLVPFAIITALHLVIGEQVPKIYAIRRPELMMLWCAPLMKLFYILLYPFQAALSWITSLLLKWLGVEGDGHGSPMTEDEIRAMVAEAHTHGELTRAEHSLISAVLNLTTCLYAVSCCHEATSCFLTSINLWKSALHWLDKQSIRAIRFAPARWIR